MTWRAISARRYAKESSSDWAVMMTRTGAFAMIPIFYCLERLTRSDGHTPYFQALAAVYAVGVAGVATSSVGREPYMGSTAQLAVPIRERLIYTMFWVVVLGVKLAFGHWLLVTPLREAIMALNHPDLCWNKACGLLRTSTRPKLNLLHPLRVSVSAFTKKVSYAAISVECLL